MRRLLYKADHWDSFQHMIEITDDRLCHGECQEDIVIQSYDDYFVLAENHYVNGKFTGWEFHDRPNECDFGEAVQGTLF